MAWILTAIMVAVITLLMTSITFLDIRREQSLSKENLEQRSLSLANTLENVLADPLYFLDVDLVDDLITTAEESQPDLTSLQVFRPDGSLLVATSQPDYPSGSLAPGLPETLVVRDQPILNYTGDDLEVFDVIKAGNQVVGIVKIEFSTESLHREIRLIIIEHIWQGLVLIGVSVILSLIVVRYATRPLRTLATAALGMGSGDLDRPVPVKGPTEITELGASLERMRIELRDLYSSLEEQVLQRTEELTKTTQGLENEIVERKLAQENLNHRNQELESANEEIRDLAKFPSEDPNPVIRISDDGIIMYANDAAANFLADRHKVGDPPSETWQELVKEALAGDSPKEVEIEYGTRLISYSLVPVPVAGYVNLYGRDVTTAKEVERLKDGLISTVSHELRTPLTSIKGATELLLAYKDEDPSVRLEFLGIIDKECDRLTRLINDLLDLATIESGRMQIQKSEVDLPEIIDTAIESTHALAMQKNLTVEIGTVEDLPKVVSDSDKLIQVLTNLLSNAIKFTPSGGVIQVQCRFMSDHVPDGNNRVEVSVSDNGVGIPGSEIEKIFDRFEQVGTNLSDRPQGSGLGLPISKEIVEHLGGTIWVESTPGKGSTFFFAIPVEQSPKDSLPR